MATKKRRWGWTEHPVFTGVLGAALGIACTLAAIEYQAGKTAAQETLIERRALLNEVVEFVALTRSNLKTFDNWHCQLVLGNIKPPELGSKSDELQTLVNRTEERFNVLTMKLAVAFSDERKSFKRGETPLELFQQLYRLYQQHERRAIDRLALIRHAPVCSDTAATELRGKYEKASQFRLEKIYNAMAPSIRTSKIGVILEKHRHGQRGI